MSNGLFTLHTEIASDRGRFESMLDAAHILNASRNTRFMAETSQSLAAQSITLLHDWELEFAAQNIGELLSPPFCFEITDINYASAAVCGLYTICSEGNKKRIASIAEEHGEKLEDDELLLDNAIFPTILTNPRHYNEHIDVIDATILAHTWQNRGRKLTEHGLTPKHPEFHNLMPLSELGQTLPGTRFARIQSVIEIGERTY